MERARLERLNQENREMANRLATKGARFQPEPTDLMRLSIMLEVLMGPELLAEAEEIFAQRLALVLQSAEAQMNRAVLLGGNGAPG